MTESPVSADFDNSLSSCDASNNDLSSYESDDLSHCDESYVSSESCNPTDSCNHGAYGYYGSGSCYYHVSYGCADSYESFDYPVSCGTVDFQDCCDEYVSCKMSDSLDLYRNVDSYEFGILSQSNVEFNDVCDAGDSPALEAVDNDVILKDYNGYSKGIDGEINSVDGLDGNIILSTQEPLTQLSMGFEENSIIYEVTNALETSVSYNDDVTPQVYKLVEFDHDDAVLADVSIGLAIICNSSEPVFDNILVTSGYISAEEVYFGTISDSELNMLLEYVGAENVILFAGLTENWDSNGAFNILNVASYEQFNEFEIDGYKFTKALLKYYPLTNEMTLEIKDNVEDEHSHVIYDTNSHGLDYAYVKHVNVIYKDMPNLMVLTSSGWDETESTEGSWDGLNDILGARMSSETLLPDHKAIWTPLLLLTQQDLQKSDINSHADDNGNDEVNNTESVNTDNECNCKNCNSSNCTCKNCHCNDSKCNCHKHHHGGGGHHKHWGHNGYSGYGQIVSAGVVTADLNNDNSTDDKNKSSNVTASGKKGKSSGYPNTGLKGAEPTYTLVYAIIGIVLVSLLFNSSYMKRDE